MKNQVSMQTIDTIVADDTGTIKQLILWKQVIDSVHTGLSYHFNRGPVTQLVEQRFALREVMSSTLAGPTLRVLK